MIWNWNFSISKIWIVPITINLVFRVISIVNATIHFSLVCWCQLSLIAIGIYQTGCYLCNLLMCFYNKVMLLSQLNYLSCNFVVPIAANFVKVNLYYAIKAATWWTIFIFSLYFQSNLKLFFNSINIVFEIEIYKISHNSILFTKKITANLKCFGKTRNWLKIHVKYRQIIVKIIATSAKFKQFETKNFN